MYVYIYICISNSGPDPPDPQNSVGNDRNWRPRTPKEQPNGRTANQKYKIPSKSQPRINLNLFCPPKWP